MNETAMNFQDTHHAKLQSAEDHHSSVRLNFNQSIRERMATGNCLKYPTVKLPAATEYPFMDRQYWLATPLERQLLDARMFPLTTFCDMFVCWGKHFIHTLLNAVVEAKFIGSGYSALARRR